MTNESLNNRYQELSRKVFSKLGERDSIKAQIKEHETKLEESATNVEVSEKASVFLQTLQDATREQIISKISAIVTDTLQKVKDKSLEFRITSSIERNQPSVTFTVYDGATKTEYDILDSCGGGIADLVSFPLRVSLLLKWSPELSRVLILDEPFKFVSVQDQELLAEFVRQLSEKLNMQMIVVTHNAVLCNKAHRVFEISKNNDTSVVNVRV